MSESWKKTVLACSQCHQYLCGVTGWTQGYILISWAGFLSFIPASCTSLSYIFFQTLLAQRSEPLGMEILTATQSIFQVNSFILFSGVL